MSKLQFINPTTGKPIVVNRHHSGHLIINQIGNKKCKECSSELVDIWNDLILSASLMIAVPINFKNAIEKIPKYNNDNKCFNKYMNSFILYYDNEEIRSMLMAKGYNI